MKTSSALLMGLGLVSSMATAQSTSNRNADVQPVTPDVRTQPASPVTGQTGGPQQLGTPSPAQSGAPGAPGMPGTKSDSRLGNQSATEPATPSEQSSGAESSGASASAIRPAPAPMSRLEPQTVNGVTYLCGGVGADEAKFMKRSAREYDMMLTFATKRGEYLSDVNVDIKDAKGKSLMQATCGGPMMLVDFPKGGTYRVHAETGGFSLNKTAHISDNDNRRTASVVMHWPQQFGQESPASTGSSTGNANGNSDSGGPADPTGQGR